MARTATPVVMEISRRFMGRLSLHPGARRKFCAAAESPAGRQSRQAGAAIAAGRGERYGKTWFSLGTMFMCNA
jgi:hypothetical protein